jgi:hypothetical protein
MWNTLAGAQVLPCFSNRKTSWALGNTFPGTTTISRPGSDSPGTHSKSGKTVLRGSYGIYYGHPLTALSFLADIVDGADSPFLVASQLTGVEDLFQGKPLTPIGSKLLDPSLSYQPDQQRYDPLSPAFLNADSALFLSPVLPTTLPIERQFRYTIPTGDIWSGARVR